MSESVLSWFIGRNHKFDQAQCDRHFRLKKECWCGGNRALHDKPGVSDENRNCTLTHFYLGWGLWSKDDPDDRPVEEESA